MCGVVVNYTSIEVCQRDGWREICDEDFTKQDAQVVCRQLGFSAIGTQYCISGVRCLGMGLGADMRWRGCTMKPTQF